MNLSPLPIQRFYSNLGFPLVNGKLFTYLAGTTTKEATYQNSTGTANSNPVRLNFRGEANIWLDISKAYKFVLAPATDTDPPTNPIWTVDQIRAPVNLADLTNQVIGAIIWPQTPEEAAAGVTPSNYGYPPYNAKRYGALGDDATDDTVALQRWLDVCEGQTAFLPEGIYRISSRLSAPNRVFIYGSGREASYLKYTGTSTITNGSMLYFSNRSAFKVAAMAFRCTSCLLANQTIQLHFEDCVYGVVEDISFGGSGSASGENNITGCRVSQTTNGFVPPRGGIAFRGILYVIEPTDSGASLSRAIHISGHASQAMEFCSFEGEGNLEHAFYALHFENAANCYVAPTWQLRGATSAEIVLTNADGIIIQGPMIAPAPTVGSGIVIDGNSFDNLVLAPVWNTSSGAPLALLTDAGVRTTVIMPGAAGTLTPKSQLWAPSSIFNGIDSTASTDGVLEVRKDQTYDRNGLVIRTPATAPAGTKAFLKIERGGDARDLIRADINGNSYFAVTLAGDNLLAITAGAKIGFFGGAGTTKPTITGSRGGNAALASLLTALANMGLLTDSTTA